MSVASVVVVVVGVARRDEEQAAEGVAEAVGRYADDLARMERNTRADTALTTAISLELK